MSLVLIWSETNSKQARDLKYMYQIILVVRKPVFGVSDQAPNQAVQPQKMARSLKFQIKKVEGLYYPCSENKGADQLCGNHEADLRLCFRICKIQFSHNEAQI